MTTTGEAVAPWLVTATVIGWVSPTYQTAPRRHLRHDAQPQRPAGHADEAGEPDREGHDGDQRQPLLLGQWRAR